MRQDIIELYDAYTHEHLDRHVFMDRLAKMAGGTAATATLVPVLEANYASAAIAPEGDARLTIEEVTFPGAGPRPPYRPCHGMRWRDGTGRGLVAPGRA